MGLLFQIANEFARYHNLIQIIFVKLQSAPSPDSAGVIARQLIHNDANKGDTPRIPRSTDKGATGQNNDAK